MMTHILYESILFFCFVKKIKQSPFIQLIIKKIQTTAKLLYGFCQATK
ncbi:hypothetical protein AsAng_0017210 [Aureispira anguillae]|uniref:Uncharacterized protein n=1 Tax=Aureispira anguillae TaxID=2864201 RepID=A0A915YDG7_9BACT|nr:hypothetical protein AsAng_0017210 [Aureispira anguillae]